MGEPAGGFEGDAATLFVRNLPFTATTATLEAFFGEVGPTKLCFVVADNSELSSRRPPIRLPPTRFLHTRSHLCTPPALCVCAANRGPLCRITITIYRARASTRPGNG